MLSVLIVGDDLVQSEAARRVIADRYPTWEIFIAQSYIEAKELLGSCKFGLFLLDTGLPGKPSSPDGLEFGKMVRKIPGYKYVPILFLAGSADNVLAAIQEVHCVSYLVKPYSLEQLTNAIDYITGMENIDYEALILKDSSGVYQRVISNDILYIETSGKNMMLHTKEHIITIANYSVIKIMQMLPYYFIRCHRKYIINRKKLISYDKSTRFVCIGQNSIPVGRKYKDGLERLLNL